MPDWINSQRDRARYRAAVRAAHDMTDGQLDRAWQLAEAMGDDVRIVAYEAEWDHRNA